LNPISFFAFQKSFPISAAAVSKSSAPTPLAAAPPLSISLAQIARRSPFPKSPNQSPFPKSSAIPNLPPSLLLRRKSPKSSSHKKSSPEAVTPSRRSRNSLSPVVEPSAGHTVVHRQGRIRLPSKISVQSQIKEWKFNIEDFECSKAFSLRLDGMVSRTGHREAYKENNENTIRTIKKQVTGVWRKDKYGDTK
ncbi:nine-cis-epoxycarotenoid dioxygenase 2, partial [Striga asiatica]